MRVIVTVAIWALSAILTAFVVATLWGWFLVPLGAPPIGLAHAYGVGILAYYVAGDRPKGDPDATWEEELTMAIAKALVMAGYALGAGWVALQLMGGAA